MKEMTWVMGEWRRWRWRWRWRRTTTTTTTTNKIRTKKKAKIRKKIVIKITRSPWERQWEEGGRRQGQEVKERLTLSFGGPLGDPTGQLSYIVPSYRGLLQIGTDKQV